MMPRNVTVIIRPGSEPIIVKPPSFKGKHNATRSKVLIVLFDRKVQKHDNSGFSARDLYVNTGCNYGYLQQKLSKWVKWGYLSKYAGPNFDGRPTWYYRLAPRGRRFLEDRLNVLNPEALQRYVAELNAFTDLIKTLNPPPSSYKSMSALISAVERAKVEAEREDTDSSK